MPLSFRSTTTIMAALCWLLSPVHAQFSMNGAAVKKGDSLYQLTPAVASRAGSIWDSTKLDISTSFDISFNLRFGCNNPGGKGIAFVLQNDNAGLKALSTNSGGMGYQPSILKSMAIEFDTQNDGTNDVANDHIAIHQNGSQNLLLAGPTSIYLDYKNVEDCGLHRVRVQYTAATNQLVVYVDCQQRLLAKIDLENDIFGGNKKVYLGFTASNGSSATPHLVQYLGSTPDLNFTLDLAPICPDSLDLKADIVRREYANYLWTANYAGNQVYTGVGFRKKWKAPQLGNYTVTLELLRLCDSVTIRRTSLVTAIDQTDIQLNHTTDTFCNRFELTINTSCTNCKELKWKFDDRGAAWGWPYQSLKLTKTTDYTGYFVATTRLNSCTASDSIFFDLNILGSTAPAPWLSADSLCAGDSLQVIDPNRLADSVVFSFGPSSGLSPLSLRNFWLKPSGFGPFAIYRNTYYSRFGCEVKDTHVVQVDTLPIAAFSALDSAKSCGRVVYDFQNNSLYANMAKWKTEKGNYTTKNLDYGTKTSARQTVVLVARNGACTDTASSRFFAQIFRKPTIDLSTDTAQGCAPFRANFIWVGSPVDTFALDLGNGQVEGGAGRTGFFASIYKPGTYDVSYTTSSGNGACQDTVLFPGYIMVLDSVFAQISFAQTGGCAPHLMNIENQSVMGNAAVRKYFLGVGSTNTPKAKEIYFLNDEDTLLTKEGIYKVVFVASNGLCADTANYQIEVKSLSKNTPVDMAGATVDSLGQVWVSWERERVATHYHLYRTDDMGSQRSFPLIKDTVFADKWAETQRAQYTYQVVAVDDCGNISGPSRPATNVLLSGAVGQNQIAQLNWTAYREFAGGVINYTLQPIGNEPITTNGLQYLDEGFLNESQPDSGRCYVVMAVENGGRGFVGQSNRICLDPLPVVYWPTAFTPGSSSGNDTFNWNGVGIKKATLSVYSRWGALIYQGQEGWDGKFQESDSPADLYYYTCHMLATNKQELLFSGRFYLMR
ncbi:MAG: gliding motility-associated C-terminal domain-containing protein [Bacteroidetes bacterium]|nr:gliding motility-associated C-terminal domain-containing protein [Bacteroidota bacterium]